VNREVFYTGYLTISPPSNTTSTGSSSAACAAVAYLNTFGSQYVNVVPTYLDVEYEGLYEGSRVYVWNGTTDCSTIPDGWYFTGESQYNSVVFHVLGGVIVEIYNRIPVTTTTTSTSTSTSTTTTTTTVAPMTIEIQTQ
jgi:hypothetical protein